MIEIDFVLCQDNFLHGRFLDYFRLNGTVHPHAQFLLDALVGNPHRKRQPVSRLKQTGDHGHRIADDIREEKRLIRLRHQGSDIAWIH